MRTALVVPSLGAAHLDSCLEAVRGLDPAPEQRILVLSGGAAAPAGLGGWKVVVRRRRLGYAAAVNEGLRLVDPEFGAAALLNDDAIPEPSWLGTLASALADDEGLAAVQGTVCDGSGRWVDGRGIGFDHWGLPIQLERGAEVGADVSRAAPVAASGTACLLRMQALRAAALDQGCVFDEAFGSYHEDLDLGLRLQRLGWRTAWVPHARAAHLGSSTGSRFRWRHPWWVLANRWRALAGNLTPSALLSSLPRLVRGEARAVRTLARSNPRTAAAAAAVALRWPLLVTGGWLRRSPGPRLAALPGWSR